jgi:predicted CXXCH cytochrome family protein
MHRARKHPALLGNMLLVSLLLVACTTATRRKMATIFLDGVPPEVSPTQAVQTATPAQADTKAPEAKAEPVPGRSSDRGITGLIVHKPYANRQCGACHESAFSQKLVGEVAELCQFCHKEVFAEAKYRHAPAESGNCLGCHNPHQSSEKALLVMSSPQLCTECHDEKDLALTVEHERIGQSTCQTCHNPHGGDRRFFLKAGWQTAMSAPPTAPAR